MARKSKPSNAQQNQSRTEKSRRERASKLILTPELHAAVSIAHLNRQMDFTDKGTGESVRGLDMVVLTKKLREESDTLCKGDLRQLEDVLLTQAQTLNAVFHRYLQQMDSAEYISQAEAYGRIAMKAQHQTRQMVATLGELKHPRRATFIKQQNNAVNQQINQGDTAAEKSENFKQPENKLLEQCDGERLEFGTAETASRADPAMATVGKVNRADD